MAARRAVREAPSRRPRARWLLPAAAAALACAAYLNTLDHPFVYDDHDTVTGNASLVDLSNLRFILVYSPFRPIVNLSYAFDRGLWGYRPFGFHLTNVVLHAVVVLLLYAWTRRILADARPERPATVAAFWTAALFAVHPIQTEAVGYVSGRSEVLCAVWFLASLLLARGALMTGSVARAAAAIACGVLSAASKETGLMLPLVVFVYDRLFQPGGEEARRRRLWRVYAPALALIAVASAYRVLAFGGFSTDRVMPAVLNGATQAIVIWRYIGLLAWPYGQSIMHAVHRVSSLADPIAWAAIAALAAVGAAAFYVRKSQPVVAFGIVWFFAVLAPSSSVLVLREGMAEHRVYLAGAGIFIALSAGLGRLFPATRRARLPYAGGLAAVLTVLFMLTVMRNRVWADPVSLWSEAAVRADGMWEPHYALADSFREAGNCAGAIPEYQRVVSLRPTHREAYTNLGICLAQAGRLDEAERAFRRVLEIDPAFARGYTNLGALALVAGDTTRARDYYREAIAQDPDNVLARMQLASLYEKTFHDYHAAARMCGEARLLAPSTPGVIECMERNQRLAAGGER